MRKTRGKNEGSIFRRADGRWSASVSLGWRGGKRWRKILYGKTRSEVAEKLTAVLRDKSLGLPVADPERQTLAEFLDRWLNDVVKQGVRPKTYRTYADIVHLHVRPAIGRIRLEKLTPQHVQRFLNEKLAAGLSPRTVKHLRGTLRNALNMAVKWGIIPRNVAALTDPPREPHKDLRVLSPEECRDFLAAVQGHRLEALFSVTLALGLRQGEALGLRWQDVDFEALTLSIRHALQRVEGKLRLVEPKTSKSRRTIALPQVAVSALYAHRQRQGDERALAGSRWREGDMVFTTGIGTPLDPRNLLREFYAIIRTSGLPRVRFHDLRHSAATLLLAQGVHARVVMDLLGHSSISLTMNTYSHVLPEFRKEAAARMDAILNPLAVNLAVKTQIAKPN